MTQRVALTKIVPNCLKLGLPLPKAILNAPELGLGLDLYFDIFQDLQTCRGGMGDGPIPWTAAKCYAKHHKIFGEDFEDMWFLISRMDDTWQENKK